MCPISKSGKSRYPSVDVILPAILGDGVEHHEPGGPGHRQEGQEGGNKKEKICLTRISKSLLDI